MIEVVSFMNFRHDGSLSIGDTKRAMPGAHCVARLRCGTAFGRMSARVVPLKAWRSGTPAALGALQAYAPEGRAEDVGGVVREVCGSCGRVEEHHAAPGCGHTPKGFRIERSVVEHFGLCAECAAA